MTSINFSARSQRIAEQRKCKESFHQWCEQQNIMPLSRWMIDNKVLTQDLFAAGLICYPDPTWLPVSMSLFSKPILTKLASSFLGQYLPEGCQYEDSPEFSYLLDETQFNQILIPHLQKASAQRRKDFIAEFKAKHGHQPSEMDLEMYSKLEFYYR